MPTHVAFLRGINLGPHRRVAGADLRVAFEGAGMTEVATFRASGNVVFDAGRGSQAKLGGRIEAALADAVGLEIDVFLRSAEEALRIAAAEPFERRLVATSAGRLQVALLAAKPSAKRRREALAGATGDDRLAFGERELYWLPSGGIRKSALGMKGIDRLVGPATVRTMGTVEELAAKYLGA